MDPHRLSRAGFTLVEILLVVAIIALLVLLSIPSLVRARQDAQAGKFVADLRVVNDAFEMYAADNGEWPAEAPAQTTPDGMEEYLTKSRWINEPAIGGVWDWDTDVFGITAGVSVVNPTIDQSVLTRIDARIDDGDLDNGAFRQVNTGRYSRVLEE